MRHRHFDSILQFRRLEIGVLLLVCGGRRVGDLDFQHVGEDHLDGPPVHELHRQPHARLQEARLYADQGIWDLGLLEALRVHEVAMLFVRVQELQYMLVQRHLFQLQFRAEGMLPHCTGVEVAQPRVHRAAHPALSRAVFRADYLICAAFESDDRAHA